MSILQVTTNGLYFKDGFLNAWTLIDDTVKSNVIGQAQLVGQCASIVTYRSTSKPPVFVGKGTLAGNNYTPSESGSYFAKILTSSYNTKFGTMRHCGCGHQKRVMISCGSTIYFSEMQYDNNDGFLTGYTEAMFDYVNIGRGDSEITGMYNLNGNLYVLMDSGVYIKPGEETDEIDPTILASDFRQVMSGQGAHHQISCISDSNVYFGNENGIYVVNGQGGTEISKPVRKYWQTWYDYDAAQIWFWDRMKWLICRPGSGGGIHQLVYDMEKKKWYYWDACHLVAAAPSPKGEKWFFFNQYDDKKLYSLERTVPGADSITQVIETGYTPLTHPHKNNRMSRVHIDASGVTKLEIYTRNSFGTAGSLYKTVNNPSRWQSLDNTLCQEVKFKCTGAGAMIYREISAEFKPERGV